MTYEEVQKLTKDCIGPYCKSCPVCNGKACGNAMPGPGCTVPGNVAARNYEKWQEVCVNMDTLCPNTTPDLSFNLFGKAFRAPVFAAPLGALQLHYGTKHTDQTYNSIMLKAAAEYGLAGFTGDGVDPEIMKSAVQDMVALDSIGIPTIKPWNKEAVIDKLDILNKNHIFAAAMDVDGAGLPFLKAMNPNAGSKTVEEMAELISYAEMPFIIKGIMTPAGARKAVKAGAKGIVVSNHGGRVQGGTPSTCEVLPAIAKEVKGETVIFVDGGIRSGLDIFRALALGADAVLIGRPVLNAIYGAGAEGFNIYMDKLLGELSSTMTMCGAASLAEITSDKVFLG